MLTYKLLNGEGPVYLQELLQYRSTHRNLRSSDQHLLLIPRTKLKTYADRSFKVAAPTEWNKLPNHIRETSSIHKFKVLLKTYLYNEAFNSCD